MPRFPASWLDDLRDRSDIVQIVSSYVSLKKNGKKWWGLCPFHGEKTASFSVDSEKQFYYCFGCKAGGSVINFVMEMEHLTFYEAVEWLAERAHMPLPQMENDADYQQRKSQRERLYAANKDAARFYHETLYQTEGADSLAYLKKRGLSDGVIRKFGLGAAPNSYDRLTRHLLERGYTLEELILAGLSVKKEAEAATADHPSRPERVRDMFRNRAMFPIIDAYGNVLAFGGRSLGDAQPKYLNTSDTPVFNKRRGVFAANLLRKERHLDRVILVEGYMDVISLTQFGVRGVCATLGTALTSEQAQLLHRFAPLVYLSYDGDAAGQHAILRGLNILAAENVPARVLDFPEGMDPDEFIRAKGAEAFDALPALTPESYRIRRLKEEMDLSTDEGKMNFAREVAKIIAPLDPVAKDLHLRDLMVQTGFSREVLQEQIQMNVPRKDIPAAQATATHNDARRQIRATPVHSETDLAQEMLISLYASGNLPEDLVTEEDFQNPELKSIYRSLREGVSSLQLIEQAPDADSRSRLTRLLLAPPAEGMDQMIILAQQCLKTIRVAGEKARMDAIMAEIEHCQDTNQRASLLAQWQELSVKSRAGLA